MQRVPDIDEDMLRPHAFGALALALAACSPLPNRQALEEHFGGRILDYRLLAMPQPGISQHWVQWGAGDAVYEAVVTTLPSTQEGQNKAMRALVCNSTTVHGQVGTPLIESACVPVREDGPVFLVSPCASNCPEDGSMDSSATQAERVAALLASLPA